MKILLESFYNFIGKDAIITSTEIEHGMKFANPVLKLQNKKS